MKAIYACKLYRASSRKSKIEAAIADPLNLELVTQLKSYLDDEYQDIVDKHEYEQKAELMDDLIDNGNSSEETLSSGSNSSSWNSGGGGFGGPSGGRPSLSEKFDMLVSGDDDQENSGDSYNDTPEDISDDSSIDDASASPDLDDIEESTAIEGVNSDVQLEEVVDAVEQAKTLLSSDPDTSGINRVLVKKDELWIHYNDDINLNNVMGPVIEKLATCNYMDFNRLARSENAVVFQLNESANLRMNSEGEDGDQ